MTWGIVATVGGTIVGGMISGNATESAGQQAAQATTDASAAQVAEAQRQFDAIRALLNPYVEAGTGALGQQQALLGLGPAGSQEAILQQLQASPQFQAMQQQGENAILQNASATGGLRGGNVQGALAQFRPALLSDMIQQHFAQLGGLTSVGQNAAAGVGNAGMASSGQIQSALGNIGAANAGAALASGQAGAQLGTNIAQIGGFLGSQLAKPDPWAVPAGAGGYMGGFL